MGVRNNSTSTYRGYKYNKITILILMLSLFVSSAFSPILQTEELYYDVVVVGGGTGGVASAIQAARHGIRVLLIEETDWIGGQATASGVSTMDGNVGYLETGIYKEIIGKLENYYISKGIRTGGCYFSSISRCYEPHVIQRILIEMLLESNVTILKEEYPTRVNVENNVITEIETNKGKTIHGKVFVDATEYGDFLSLAGDDYKIGKYQNTTYLTNSCVQDITYVAVVKKYYTIPDELKIKTPPPGYTHEIEQSFAKIVSPNGSTTWRVFPTTWETHKEYRAIPNSGEGYSPLYTTKTEINMPNDFPSNDYFNPSVTLSTEFIENKEYRKEVACAAKMKTIYFLYYLQAVLGKSWSISTDEGYDTPYNRQNACESIPLELKTIEYNLPPIPYVRESRRGNGLLTVTAKDIQRTDVVNPIRFNNSIATGDYGNDLHNCNTENTLELYENLSDISTKWSAFTVPIESLISNKIYNLIYSEKNISMSRLANGALRLQPITMLVGQAGGELAAVSATENKYPRFVDYKKVQMNLAESNDSVFPFSDATPSSTIYYKEIQASAIYSIMTGYPDNTFKPKQNITRGQMSAILSRLLNIQPVQPVGLFVDVPASNVFAPYIESLYLNGITTGCSQSPLTYCISDYVTKAQFAVFYYRAKIFMNPDEIIPISETPSFTDVQKSFWAYNQIEYAYKSGIITGCYGTLFCPSDTVAREISAFFIYKYKQ